jgi:hypothetical protein
VMRFLRAQLQQLGIHEPAGPTDPIGAEQTPVTVGPGARPTTSPWPSPDQHHWQPARAHKMALPSRGGKQCRPSPSPGSVAHRRCSHSGVLRGTSPSSADHPSAASAA